VCDGSLFVQKIDARSGPDALVAQDLEFWVQEETLKGIDLELHLLAFVQVAILEDAHVPFCLGQIFGLVILQLICLDDHAALAQLGLPLNLGLQVGLPGDLVAKQEHRLLFGLGASCRPCQLRAGFECHRSRTTRLGILR
jgi:hypothetical protein